MRISGLAAGSALIVTTLLGASGAARADTILWIDDSNGNIGQVDVTTHAVSGVHNTFLGGNLTDIGFTQNGTLYGTTFTTLYSINTTSGNATSIANYNGQSGMNALVGDGSFLLGATSNNDSIFDINAATAALSSSGFTSPVASAGDLAFSGSTLFESGVDANGPNSGDDELVNASTGAKVADFTLVGSPGTHFTGVFGLADDGTTMYAVNNTSVYSVNLTNGALTFIFDYSGHGLFAANGTAFQNEASNSSSPAPEPSSIAIFGAAIAGLGSLLGRRRKA